MGTSEPDDASARRNRVALIAFGVLVVVVGVVLNFGLRSPPQMGTSEEVFNTVDALFTAVTAKDERLLADCEKRLRGCREAGKLPADAADTLDAVIRKARSGSWNTAAERLYDFMKGQRREGAIEARTQTHRAPTK